MENCNACNAASLYRRVGTVTLAAVVTEEQSGASRRPSDNKYLYAWERGYRNGAWTPSLARSALDERD